MSIELRFAVLDWLPQAVYNGLHRLTEGGPQHFSRRIARRVLTRIRARLVVAAHDPRVRAPFLGNELTFPLSHNLVLYRRERATYSQNLSTVARAAHTKYPHLRAIDVGGNIGDSVILMRSAGTFPVLTIEGDPRFHSYLEANLARFDDITIDRRFVGAIDNAPLVLTREGGTSRLSRSHEATSSSVALESFASIIADYPEFAMAKLLKIDADGFDFAIIENARDWIASTRPILFFEYDPILSAGNSVTGLQAITTLTQLGYATALVWDNHGRFFLGSSLSRSDLFEDLDGYVGKGTILYWDMCCFHQEDVDLFEQLWVHERRERCLQS